MNKKRNVVEEAQWTFIGQPTLSDEAIAALASLLLDYALSKPAETDNETQQEN